MSPADRISLAVVACLTALSVIIGVRTAYREVDVDEVVFRDTLVSMRQGDGYYPAMRDALIGKEGSPPSQVRSIRPPTLYLFLSRFPAASWRYLVGAVYLGVLLLAWRLGRPLHAMGGPLATVLVGLWMLGTAPLFFLHAELWGLPFLLGGALALRRRQWAWAMGALALAALLREIYVLALVVGAAMAARKREWLPTAAGALVLAGGAVHFALASDVLSPTGREPPFGASGLSPSYFLSALSPPDLPFGWLIGLSGLALGLWGLRRRWRHDDAALLLLVFAVVMIPVTIFFGRQYWGLTFGPAVACYAPAGLPPWRRAAAGVDRADA